MPQSGERQYMEKVVKIVSHIIFKYIFINLFIYLLYTPAFDPLFQFLPYMAPPTFSQSCFPLRKGEPSQVSLLPRTSNH